ncbi:MAG: hypothetical protein ACYDA3_08050 [Gaiellaceae bacterium]
MSYAMVASTFGQTETITKSTAGPNLFHLTDLACNYCLPGRKVNEGQYIQYDHGTVANAKAYFRYQRKSSQGNAQRLGGIGGEAITATGSEIRWLLFRDGGEVVAIKGGDRKTPPPLQGFETLAKYDDVAEAAQSWTSPTLRNRLRVLSQRLDEMSGDDNTKNWEPEALGQPEWAEVRSLAAEVLDAFG